ncbi:MAG: DUF1284 domain-containing protein [Oscillospiraceae bacterium]|nr:DUF1284 domain-containing protein [Oscillospiraceae bacterium]
MYPYRIPLPLRPHHGMCLAYFRGLGYSGAFARGMEKTKAELETGAAVRLSLQPDKICAACPNLADVRCASWEKVERYDRHVLALCSLSEGTVLPYPVFSALIRHRILLPGLREKVCGDCCWNGLCR